MLNPYDPPSGGRPQSSVDEHRSMQTRTVSGRMVVLVLLALLGVTVGVPIIAVCHFLFG